MAGRFRGSVAKLAKAKKSRSTRKGKAKKVTSLVKRSPKLEQSALQRRIAQLIAPNATVTSTTATTAVAAATAPATATASSSTTSRRIRATVTPHAQPRVKLVGKAAMDVVGERVERVVPRSDVPVTRTSTEAAGLRMLNQAIKDQSYNKILPHQQRHDYEYSLRSIATMGVVQLFNSLAQARKAAAAVDAQASHMTADKVIEKKEVVSRDAFLAALRQAPKATTF